MKFVYNMMKLYIVVIFVVVVFVIFLENKCNVFFEFWCSLEEVVRDC